MTSLSESTFRKVFSQFLDLYWGAFHEALEAQSVTPTRLAGSLFKTLLAEHRAFADIYDGPARPDLDRLGQLWHQVEARRYQLPDPPLVHDDIVAAHGLFKKIYDSLVKEGSAFAAARKDVLAHARHGTPATPLRPDAAR